MNKRLNSSSLPFRFSDKIEFQILILFESFFITFQSFYSTKLEEQILLTKDNEAKSLWNELKTIMPQFFEGIEVKPSLLHGDLWSGNAGTVDGKPGNKFKLRYEIYPHYNH